MLVAVCSACAFIIAILSFVQVLVMTKTIEENRRVKALYLLGLIVCIITIIVVLCFDYITTASLNDFLILIMAGVAGINYLLKSLK